MTLVLPYIVNSINEKMFYIFAIVNVISIPIGKFDRKTYLGKSQTNAGDTVWALYPESNQRTLEEMDLLFAADEPWTWSAEKKFAELKEEQSMSAITNAHHGKHTDIEKADSSRSHIEVTKA